MKIKSLVLYSKNGALFFDKNLVANMIFVVKINTDVGKKGDDASGLI